MRIALDTNILAYAEGVNGSERRQETLSLLQKLAEHEVLLPAQTLGELFAVLTRKAGRSAQDAKAALLSWTDSYRTIPTTTEVLTAAADIAADHRLGYWDAVVLAAAAAGGCRLLLSEDLQDGFGKGGVSIANPYLTLPNPILGSVLNN